VPHKQLEAGEYAEAIKIFEQARKIDDQQFELHEGLGTAHFMVENYIHAFCISLRLRNSSRVTHPRT